MVYEINPKGGGRTKIAYHNALRESNNSILLKLATE